jgi:pilus assembly protein CpaC
MVSVLAEPNLTALSGETASFLAGGEFPVPVGVDDNEIEIQFKQFGVSLAFTPTVVSAERINLKLRSEVSQLSEAAGINVDSIEVPGLTTRRADTTIELASGQSFAVAGLLQNREVNDISKLPGLGSIPILGKLFQSRRYLEEETELIIIATPYLVQPVDPDTPLRTPADRGEASQQFEQLLESFSSNAITSSGERSRLNSPVGFIME